MGWLVADIGGTNTRCALAAPGGQISRVEAFRNRDFPGLDAVLASYLGMLPPAERPEQAVLAIAAPIRGDEVRMSNINWAFSVEALARKLALKRVTPLNDFAAQAYALPVLQREDLVQVGGGVVAAGAPKVVIGPGTGLGAAGLVQLAGRWHAVTGEGGHVTMAPSDERESRIVALGRERYGHCSAERLVSGAGLAFLYQAMHGGPAISPDEVGVRIKARESNALDTLEMFFQFLATAASNLALTFAAFGGVYIGGGITPRYVAELKGSGFRARFEDKGRYRALLADIPTYVVTTEYAALRGLAAFAEAA
jgi:glucokinase